MAPQPPTGSGIGRSHAKAILSGEHAVVYGKPAIAFPVHSLRLQAEATLGGNEVVLSTPYHTAVVRRDRTMNTGLARQLAEAALVNTLNVLESRPEGMTVRVSGEIPPARGLGSSAAVAASIASAVASAHEVTLTSDEHFDIVQSVERIAHGTPSGLDARATVASGPIWFEAGQAKPLRSQRTPRMLVADTGVKGHTSEAVAHVRNLRQADEGRIDLLLNDIAVLTERAGTALERGQMSELGDLLTSNHRLLAELGVSHPKLDRLVAVALAAGALGAKMTGGGRGGCMIALAGDEDSERQIEAALREAGATSVWNVSKRDEQ